MVDCSFVRYFVFTVPKRTKKPAAALAPNYPPHHPEAVANMAAAMPWKTKVRFFEVEAYTDAICKLYDRGYSYAEITDWLNERLADKLGEKRIKRGQVYRVHQQWLALSDPMNDGFGVPHISDAEAEEKAALSDKKAPKPEKEKMP